MTIAKVALPVATAAPFDYWVPAGLAVACGAVVKVELGGRRMHGVVVELATESVVPRERLHPLSAVVTALPPLPPDLLELAAFVAGYYQEPLGMVLAQMLPPPRGDGAARVARSALALTDAGRAALPPRLARAPRARELFALFAGAPATTLDLPALAALPAPMRTVVRRWCAAGWLAAPAVAPPAAEALRQNADQQAAVAAILAGCGRYAPYLLQGVTGSGKTEVYLAAAEAVIAAGGQVLMLVPEINLTPQLEQRIGAAFPGRRTATLHSRLAAGERRSHWLAAAAGDADLVLGTRLAVFAPLPRLALIIVDEEHDPSFKQQDNVRYHGRDLAVWRARRRGVPIVLGSATPALESLVQAQRGRYSWLRLPRRAAANARLPTLRLVPDRVPDTHEGMSAPLVAAIAARLARGEQSLVFINRRGFAPSLLCAACGWQAGCPRCSARLVVHRDAGLLRCHHCGHAERLSRACPDCGNVDLLPLGHGTQRLERALATLFPAARILRVDRDSTRRRDAFATMRDDVHAGSVDILVGTQMLAKGHDFPRLTLVGVLGADNALYSADFRATERLAALLFQVGGRAGRAEIAGEVIVQTDVPGHSLYRALVAHDYDALAASLLAEREVACLPPYAHLALLGAEATRREAVDAFLQSAHAAGVALARAENLAVDVYPPLAPTLARRAGVERAQVLVQSAERGALQRFLPRWRSAIEAAGSRRVRWAIDVDPLGFG